MKPPSFLKEYFWNARFDQMDTQKHSGDIIRQLLESGNTTSLKWMLHTYAKSDVEEVVRTSKNLSPRSKMFWFSYFGIPLPHNHARTDSAWHNRGHVGATQ